jgi:outer membrane protein assembly factor BamB
VRWKPTPPPAATATCSVSIFHCSCSSLAIQERMVQVASTGSTGSSPAVADSLVYLAQDPIYAFDALSGALRWVSESVGAYNDDSPLVANGVIYVCSSGHYTLYALDATSGRVLWTSPASGDQTFTMPAVADGVVYVSAGNRNVRVYAFHLPRR